MYAGGSRRWDGSLSAHENSPDERTNGGISVVAVIGRNEDSMYDAILVPTDGSETASNATDVAISLAKQHDATLHVIHVVEFVDLPGEYTAFEDELVERGNQVVNEVDKRARNAGIESHLAVLEQDRPTHETILAYATDHDIDLFVMGTHGRTGVDRFLLGSVTERTLAAASQPVLTVRDEATLADPLESILVPYDGSAGAHAAAMHAIELAQETGAALQFCFVIDRSVLVADYNNGVILDSLEQASNEVLEEVTDAAADAGVPVVDAPVLVGPAHKEIVEYAGDADVDCIIMGTNGRAGLGQHILGSVTERVVRQTDVPVMALRAQPDE